MGYQDKTNINWRIGSCIPNHGYSNRSIHNEKMCFSVFSSTFASKTWPQGQKLKPGESVFHRIPKFLSICWLSVAIHHCPLVSFSIESSARTGSANFATQDATWSSSIPCCLRVSAWGPSPSEAWKRLESGGKFHDLTLFLNMTGEEISPPKCRFSSRKSSN